MHSRSVADLLESPLDHLLLPYAITFSTPSMHRVSTAPAPVSLASVDSENGSVHIGRARIGGDVKASISALKALFCSSPHGTFSLFALLVLNLGSLSRSEMGATPVLYWGTNCRNPVMPSSTRTSSTVFGLDSCVIASILLGAERLHAFPIVIVDSVNGRNHQAPLDLHVVLGNIRQLALEWYTREPPLCPPWYS